MKIVKSDWVISIILFLLTAGIYCSNGDFLLVGDSESNVYLARNIVQRKILHFTPSDTPILFQWQMQTAEGPRQVRINNWEADYQDKPLRDWYREGKLRPVSASYNIYRSTRVDSQTREKIFVNTFGIGTALTAAPVFFGFQLWRPSSLDDTFSLNLAGKLAALTLVALSVSILYVTLRSFLARKDSIILALVYGLCTGVWSISTQTLWQHGATEFWLALGICFLLWLPRKNPRIYGFFSGLAFACATLCRPTGLFFLVAVGLYLMWKERRAVVAFAAGSVPVLLALAFYNHYYLGSFGASAQMAVSRQLALQYTGTENVWSTPFWKGLAGILISPSHGLLIYTPLIIFSVIGLSLLWRKERQTSPAFWPLIGASLLILLTQSLWYDWSGGMCYGNRPLVDISAVLVLLLVPAWAWLRSNTRRMGLFALCAVWCFGVQVIGAYSYDAVSWFYRNENGVDMAVSDPKNHYRYWSISDNPLLYYATHFKEGRQKRRELIGLE